MTRKTKPITHVIKFGKVIMWPVIPIVRKGVNLARQRGNQITMNVVVLPVVRVAGRTNWMDHVHLKPNNIGVVRATMRRQRVDQGFEQAQERLREIFMNPA